MVLATTYKMKQRALGAPPRSQAHHALRGFEPSVFVVVVVVASRRQRALRPSLAALAGAIPRARHPGEDTLLLPQPERTWRRDRQALLPGEGKGGGRGLAGGRGRVGECRQGPEVSGVMCGRLYAGVWSGCGKEIVLLHLRFVG